MICSLESRGKVAEELKRADAVVLTYACDQPSTLNRLTTFWLYEFRRLEVLFFFFSPINILYFRCPICVPFWFIVNVVKLKNILVYFSLKKNLDISELNKK